MKYRPKYARQLIKGEMCDEHGKPYSIEKCCLIWKVTKPVYYAWIEKHPKFAHAAEMAKLNRAIWWQDLNEAVACGTKKGNAGLIQFALKNIEGINWADKVEVNSSSTHEEIRTLNIKMLEPSKIALLEHDDIQDAELIDDSSTRHPINEISD